MSKDTQKIIERELATLPPGGRELVAHVLKFQKERELTWLEFAGCVKPMLAFFAKVIIDMKKPDGP